MSSPTSVSASRPPKWCITRERALQRLRRQRALLDQEVAEPLALDVRVARTAAGRRAKYDLLEHAGATLEREHAGALGLREPVDDAQHRLLAQVADLARARRHRRLVRARCRRRRRVITPLEPLARRARRPGSPRRRCTPRARAPASASARAMLIRVIGPDSALTSAACSTTTPGSRSAVGALITRPISAREIARA